MTALPEIPNYRTGTWTIDPVHSEVGFVVRHMMVSKVRGKFGTFEGTVTTAEEPLKSSAEATIDLGSIDTGNEQRDNHLRSSDFFEVDRHTKMTYRSTGVRLKDGEIYADGELTIRDVTRAVELRVEVNGFGPDPFGGTRVGFTAAGEINRSDFGITYNGAIEGGGVIISDKVTIQLEVEAVLDA